MPRHQETTRISIVIPDTMLRALKAQARREKRPYSSLIREAIEAHFGIEDTVRLGGLRYPEDDEQGQAVAVATA